MTRLKPVLFIIFFTLAGTALCAAPRVISVLYFENTTGNKDYAWFSKGVADMLTTDLAAVPDFTVIERGQLQKILKEQELALSDLFDQKSAVRVGKLLSAREVVIGSYIIHQQALRIDAKVVDIETGKVLKTVQTAGELGKIFSVQKEVTAGILRELDVTGAAPARRDTESVDAAKAYYTGIDFLDQGAFDAARQSFQQAIKADPFYAKPQKSLEDAYRFLKDFKKQRFQRELARLYELASQLKARLDAPRFLSYGEFITEAYKKGMSPEQMKRFTDANPAIMKGDTRAVCTWELQNTLGEIADAAEENFDDAETAVRMYNEMIHIADQARVTLKDDPFFPEILYQEVLAFSNLQDWERMMPACEYLMEHYPDYRMMWAVEDFYARAIEKLGGKKADDED